MRKEKMEDTPTVYFVIRHVPSIHNEALTKWASNTCVRFEATENAGLISLAMERKHPTTAKALKRACREVSARCKNRLPADLPDDWIEACDAMQFQAVEPAVPISRAKNRCAMEALKDAEIAALPHDFDARAGELYAQLLRA